MREATLRRVRSCCAVLALPVALALVASCGTDPAAPDAAATPPSLGRGGLPGPSGSISVTLNTLPDDPQEFSVTLTSATGTKISTGKGTAKLVDDADPTLSNTRTWPSLAAGDYKLTMNVGALPPGYQLTSIDCVFIGASETSISFLTGIASFSLATGGQVACTYTVRVVA